MQIRTIMELAPRNRAACAAWSARIISIALIVMTLVLVLPVFKHSPFDRPDAATVASTLGAACSEMLSRLRQVGSTSAEHWPGAYPECWPAAAKSHSTAAAN